MNRNLVFCLVALVLMAGGVGATQIIYQTPKQMGAESTLVVRGHVATVRSFWNDSNTKILTETIVNIDESYKGEGETTARVLQLGGVVGTVRMHVHGAPTWTRGEEVVLFLESIDAASYRVSGLSQGKFKVERDPVTGDPFISYPMMGGVEVLGAPTAGEEGGAPRSIKVPLDDFISDALGTSQQGGR
ncbi:MAG: hypothetical protein JSW50_02220 [Candidatus Latescibacterota bacterium]|nr:MAG: hypothetical protein JSW50_02220 [Candidatus Latescibacterota bacterium]